MHTEAELYDVLYASGIDGKDDSAGAGQIADLVRRVRPHSRTLLDAACGTAEHAGSLSEVHGIAATTAGALQMSNRLRS